MKKNSIMWFVLVLILAGFGYASAQQTGQDSTGLPGDNFSLQGAIDMFKNSKSPEDFEKAINAEDNHINNLDLNGDGDIDYVKVIDQTENNVHVFVLQVPVSDQENQDIASIELEKTGDSTAVLQIVGNEDIYGDEVIFEPSGEDDSATPAKGKGPSHGGYEEDDAYVVVNVWYWPCVRYVYAPIYRPWVSPWYWHYYPSWWRPWRPLGWHYWHPYYGHYHHSYVVVHTRRVAYAPHIYGPHRATSVTVRTRNATAINNYHVSRTRSTTVGPRGSVNHSTKTTVSKSDRSASPSYRSGQQPSKSKSDMQRSSTQPQRSNASPSRSSGTKKGGQSASPSSPRRKN